MNALLPLAAVVAGTMAIALGLDWFSRRRPDLMVSIFGRVPQDRLPRGVQEDDDFQWAWSERTRDPGAPGSASSDDSDRG